MSMNWMTTMEMTLMRDILFRGKRIDNGEWVEGYLYEHEPPLVGIVPENYVLEPSKWFIVRTAFADWNLPRQVEFVEVDPSTVGQYTGLKDKNGKRIWEGDIIKWDYAYNEGKSYQVIYDVGGACFSASREHNGDNTSTIFYNDEQYAEVIGNIHDNQELLERGE